MNEFLLSLLRIESTRLKEYIHTGYNNCLDRLNLACPYQHTKTSHVMLCAGTCAHAFSLPQVAGKHRACKGSVRGSQRAGSCKNYAQLLLLRDSLSP